MGEAGALAEAIYRAGIEAFGELEVDAAGIEGVVEAALDSGVARDQLHRYAAEVYLGAACGAGAPLAAVAVDRDYIARVGSMIAAKRLPPYAVDEVCQTVRERLFAGQPPYIAGAVGRGALSSLVAVIANRAAIDWLRAHARLTGQRADETAAAEIPARGDPAIDHQRTQFRAAVKAAFEAAAAELTARERTLLRLHLVDQLTIDDIAALYHVHRATAARQIERARERVASATRRLLADGSALDPQDLAELAALVTSQLDLSLSRVLRDQVLPV